MKLHYVEQAAKLMKALVDAQQLHQELSNLVRGYEAKFYFNGRSSLTHIELEQVLGVSHEAFQVDLTSHLIALLNIRIADLTTQLRALGVELD